MARLPVIDYKQTGGQKIQGGLFVLLRLIGNHHGMTENNSTDDFPGRPGIGTAIPRRRYKLGEFTLIVLGDIESKDGLDYQYIMAVIRGEDPEPGIYITAERGNGAGQRELSMRFIMRDGSEVIGSSSQWGDLDAFVDEATGIVTRVLSLGDETPYRLM